MWYLKIKYKHSDCIVAPKLQELGINIFHYYLGNYVKGNYIYVSSMEKIIGSEKSVKKYVRYLKNHKQVSKVESYKNIIFTLMEHKKDLKLYETIYNPAFLYPHPAYLSKDGFEIIEVASWDRKSLENLIKTLEKNKTTTHFEILKFVDRKVNDVYTSKLLPDLPPKQKQAMQLAFQFGYYEFPRKTNLDKLAKVSKVSKPTFRENLRKAEAKLMPHLISE